MEQDSEHVLHRALPSYDMVLTYGGGDPVVRGYERMGARMCVPVYNALDPETHHLVPHDPAFACTLSFLGNRLPDREARVEEFFLKAAGQCPSGSFLLGGSGWETKDMPENVRHIGHVGTRTHNAFFCSGLATLNVNRDSMARYGFSPPTRVFEAAGAGPASSRTSGMGLRNSWSQRGSACRCERRRGGATSRWPDRGARAANRTCRASAHSWPPHLRATRRTGEPDPE